MDNNFKTDYGFDIVWAKKENYGSKIMVFSNHNKTDFVFHKNTEKTWFINSGKFKIKWIDTTNGKIFEQIFEEGNVFEIEKLKPYSVQCISTNGSITEANNGIDNTDVYVSLSREFFE